MAPITIQPPVYLPAAGDRPAEPAPFVLTEADVIRMARINCKDPYACLRRYRKRGWLKATQLGNQVVYLLEDVIKFMRTAREENPR